MINMINLRGANGSGKSYVVKTWMTANKAEPYPRVNNLLGGTSPYRSPDYYKLKDGGAVIGDYQRDCGGCDTVDTQEAIRERIVLCLEQGCRYVLFEGVIVSTIFESWLNFSRRKNVILPGEMLWAYLDTPLDVCVQRVYKRNANQKINEKLVADKIRNIQATQRKATEAGEEVLVLNWKRAERQFFTEMRRRFPV